MTELEIKKIIIDHLLSDESVMAVGTEVPYQFGKRRADVIAISDNVVNVYEIKSQNDNISGLPLQLQDYRLYFDAVNVVCENSNLEKVRRVTPYWAGISLVVDGGFKQVRKAKITKSLNKLSLLSTLPTTQLKSCTGVTRRLSKYEMCQQFAKQHSLEQIKQLSREYLTQRYYSPTKLLKSERNQFLHTDDLVTLTRPPTSVFRKS